MSDGELDGCIARTAGGDAGALHEIYTELRGAVFALALSVTGDRPLAEDVLQDVFVKVYAGACSYRRGNPRAWIMRIARNQAISALRKRRRELPVQEPREGREGSEGDTASVPEALELNRALETLDGTEREVVLLSVLAELPNREVAGLLGIPRGSVSWRYRTAIEKLREYLSGSLHERED